MKSLSKLIRHLCRINFVVRFLKIAKITEENFKLDISGKDVVNIDKIGKV